MNQRSLRESRPPRRLEPLNSLYFAVPRGPARVMSGWSTTSFQATTRVRLPLTAEHTAVQKVAGPLRVPSADLKKRLLLAGRGTWIVPTTVFY